MKEELIEKIIAGINDNTLSLREILSYLDDDTLATYAGFESPVEIVFTGADVYSEGRCKAASWFDRTKYPHAETQDMKNMTAIDCKTITDIDDQNKYEWYQVGQEKYSRYMYCPKTNTKRSQTIGEFYQSSVVN